MIESNYRDLGNTVVLLISGKAGTGKSFSCALLQILAYDLGFLDCITASFAKELKRIAEYVFHWDGAKDDGGRKLLQDLGRVARDYNKDFWADYLLNEIQNHPVLYDFVFIDDWRFPNEAKYFKENSDFIIKTVRISSPEREMLRGTEAYNDVSETSLSDNPKDYDYFVDNSKDRSELILELSKIFASIIKETEEQYV